MRTLLIALLAALALNAGAQTTRTLHVKKAGTMVEQLTEDEANQITHLTLTGKINAVDFRHLRDEFRSLVSLDISGASISAYSGKLGTYPGGFYIYPPQCVPAYAFCHKADDGRCFGKPSLREVILSSKIKNIEDAAFKGCLNLRILRINTASAPNMLTEAVADSITAVFTQPGQGDSYRTKKGWEQFAVFEAEPITAIVGIAPQGSLAQSLADQKLQPANVHFLTVVGKMDDADFLFLRDYMPNLVTIDLEQCRAEAIPDFAFTQKKYLLHIDLPGNLRRIGQRAFSGCRRLCGPLVLPRGVNAIEMGAFIGCERLREVVVTGRVLTTVGDNLFSDSPGQLVYK